MTPLKNSFGISLVQVIISLGILAVGAKALLSLQQTSIKNIKYVDARTTLANEVNRIRLLLLKREICEINFKNILLTKTKPVVEISEFKNEKNIVVLKKDKKLSTSSFRINSMRIIRDFEKEQVNFELLVSTNKNEIGGKNLKKIFNLNVNLNDDKIISCYSDIGLAVETSLFESCKNLGGIYSPDDKECSFNNKKLIQLLNDYSSLISNNKNKITNLNLEINEFKKIISNLPKEASEGSKILCPVHDDLNITTGNCTGAYRSSSCKGQEGIACTYYELEKCRCTACDGTSGACKKRCWKPADYAPVFKKIDVDCTSQKIKK